jgi:hypothetical protein
MQSIALAFATSTEFRVLAPAMISGLMTILIAPISFFVRGRFEFTRTCLLTLGLMPFLVYSVVHAPFLPNFIDAMAHYGPIASWMFSSYLCF